MKIFQLEKFVWLQPNCHCNVGHFLIEKIYVNHVFISFFQIILLMLIVPLGRKTTKHVK